MGSLRRAVVAGLAFAVLSAAQASDYLFLSRPYLARTKAVIADARRAGPDADKTAFIDALETKVDAARDSQIFKRMKDEDFTDREDKAFADALNDFKDVLTAMAEDAGKKKAELFPSWTEWNKTEVSLVGKGLDRRLSAYKARFGPESEPINLVEFLASQTLLSGDESGPSAWEPIARLSAVQATSRGPGVTSTVEVGMNRYFLSGRPPTALRLIGLQNHLGLAATLQYLDNPGIFRAKGRPTFGLMLHLDRKEVGVSWDNAEDRLNVTVGYAFQVVPMVM